MPLKTPEAARGEPAGTRDSCQVGGERLNSIVDHPAIAPHINTVAKTYELAHTPEHLDVMTAESHLTGHQQAGPAAWTRRPRRQP